jgi:hypothetical protein
MSTYKNGIDVLGRTTLGPRGRNILGARTKQIMKILGVEVREWDNHNTYEVGDVVYYAQKYWRAAHRVEPPFFPALMDGEVPGHSDKWDMAAQSTVLGARTKQSDRVFGGGRSVNEIYDDTYFGMEDIAAKQRNMNDLKPVVLEIARILLKGGQEAIAGAITGAKQPWYKSDLPGDTARKNVQAHLQWHAQKLSMMMGDPLTTIYDSGDDLKKWVMQAYIEGNAVEEGAAYLEAAWQAMWGEIETKLKAIPKWVGNAATSIVKEALKSAGEGAAEALGIPTWLLYTAGAAVVGAVGYVGYRVYIRRG